jgi:mannose-6-phosphate isomerase
MAEPAVLVLDNPILDYAWGSRSAIAELLGRPTPSPGPEAELWIGAHPKAPSRIVEPGGLGTLDTAIQDDPMALLGGDVCDRFGNELPFLFKVIAAQEPLSIQAHPNQDQARAGWARENAEGIPLDAPRRNYRDLNHKPELVCALAPFVALKGFRPLDEVARGLDAVARPELGPETGRLARERTPLALRALFARLMTLDGDEREPLLRRAAAEAARRRADPAWQWVARLLAAHPGDVGALAPLYLNLVTLAPGEALFLAAGELHSYLEGTALEIMANSDNVLRGGLTPKHVDVQELLSVLVFDAQPAERLAPIPAGPGEACFRTPAREFELALLEVEPKRPFTATGGRGVEILLQLEGECRLAAGASRLPLPRGRSVVVPAALPTYALEGAGRLARARVPA